MLAVFLLIAAALTAIVYFVFFRIAVVGTNNMAPSVIAGEKVLLYETQDFNLGDIVICEHPGVDGQFVMGRVVGRPGDKLQMHPRTGHLSLNGESFMKDHRGEIDFTDATRQETYRVKWGVEKIGMNVDDHFYFERPGYGFQVRDIVLEQGLFLLSDNRGITEEDSRSFGPVPALRCKGKIVFRLTPSPLRPQEIPIPWGRVR